jgi:hypothetical protein
MFIPSVGRAKRSVPAITRARRFAPLPALLWITVMTSPVQANGPCSLRIGVYFTIRRFANVCAIEVNTPLSWIACCTL